MSLGATPWVPVTFEGKVTGTQEGKVTGTQEGKVTGTHKNETMPDTGYGVRFFCDTVF